MRFFNWANNFDKSLTYDEIKKRIHKTEIQYWILLLVSLFIAFGGLGTIEQAKEGDMKQIGWGIFLIVLGLVHVAVIKIWAHTKILTYYMIWERRKWVEEEIKKSEAADI